MPPPAARVTAGGRVSGKSRLFSRPAENLLDTALQGGRLIPEIRVTLEEWLIQEAANDGEREARSGPYVFFSISDRPAVGGFREA